MVIGWSDGAVVGKDSVEIHCQHSEGAYRNEAWLHVEDIRREVRPSSEAGEEVAGKEQAAAWTQEAHVTSGVAGEVNGLETLAAGETKSILDPVIDLELAVAKEGPTSPFEESADAGGASVGVAALEVESIAAGSGDPGTGLGHQSGDVPSMVEVAMGQDDAFDREGLPPAAGKLSAQCRNAKKKAAVDEVEGILVRISQNVEHDPWRGDDEDIVQRECRGHGAGRQASSGWRRPQAT